MAEHERILNKLLNEIAKEKYEVYNAEVKPVAGSGGSFTAKLFEAKITSPGEDDLHLFAKVSAMGEKLRTQSPVTRLYAAERFFYTELAEIYRKLEERHKVPLENILNLPRYYGSNGDFLEETIVIENLAKKGFVMHDRLKTVDWCYAAKAVAELAKFHALSISYSEEEPEHFVQLLKDLSFDLCAWTKPNWEQMVSSALRATREENRSKLETFLIDIKDKLDKFSVPLRRPTLCHGDFKTSNFMHRELPDGPKLIVLDYQTLHSGSGLTDLMYFVFNGTDGEFREQHFDALLQHYYQELCAALRRFGVDPDQVYSKEDFDYECEQMLPYGLLTGVFSLQLVTIELRDAPQIGAITDLSHFVFPTGDSYAHRLNGIVDDYVKWGVL